MKQIISKHRLDFFKSNRASNINTNTNRPPIQLNIVNPANNTRDDPRANITFYILKKIQKYYCNEHPGYLFIILDDPPLCKLISENNVPIIQLWKIYRIMHISCVIYIQTVHDSIKEPKRLIDDVFYIDISFTTT
jgi:hypothetical protein